MAYERLIKCANWLSDEDKQLILKFLIGGSMMGGGAALLTAMKKQMDKLKEDTSSDDDILYVRPKKEPELRKAASNGPNDDPIVGIGGGIGLAGGAAAMLSTYAIVQSILARKERDAAQQELDEAQQAFIDSRGYELAKSKEKKKLEKQDSITKKALFSNGQPMDVAEMPRAMLISLPLLTLLASGAITYNWLDKNNPIKKPKVSAPRKIEILDDDEDDPAVKEACAHTTLYDGAELVMRLLCINKKACDTRNSVQAIAEGQWPAFKNVCRTCNYDTALNTVKTANAGYIDPLSGHVAMGLLMTNDMTKEAAATMAAVDFANTYPVFVRAASLLPDKMRNCLAKVACLYGRAVRYQLSSELDQEPTIHEKVATAAEIALAALHGPDAISSLVVDKSRIGNAANTADAILDTQEASGMESDEMLDASEKTEKKPEQVPIISSGSPRATALTNVMKNIDDIDVIIASGKK